MREKRSPWWQRMIGSVTARVLELFYGPLAPLYPALTRLLFGENWRDWQRVVLPFVSPAALVLELGCGPGALAADLAALGKQVIALDRSLSMLRTAQRRLRTASLRRRVRLVCADARALPLADGTVDAVVMTFPTAVFLDQRMHAEVARVLRPGGLFVAVAAVSVKRWPRWLWPSLPLVRRLFPADPSLPTPLRSLTVTIPGSVGRWTQLELPSGVVHAWIAQRVTEDPSHCSQ